MDENVIVYVVDDDPGIRNSLKFAFNAVMIQSQAFQSADDFLNADRANVPSCLILDLQLPGQTGLDLLKLVAARDDLKMPVIVVTGTGNISSAVQSMKLGVVEFLEKPVQVPELVEKVRSAFEMDAKRRDGMKDVEAVKNRFARLTPREWEHVHLICRGLSNKQIARQLNISIKTVANHRAKLLAKAQAVNTADMVRLATLAGGLGPHAN